MILAKPQLPQIEALPAADPWSSTSFFETVRICVAHFGTGQATRAWTAQVLVDQMHRVSRELKAKRLDAGEANRLILTVFQHLELIYRSRGGRFSSRPPLVLRDLDLTHQVYTGLNLNNLTFHSCDLTGSDLSGGRWLDCTFTACSFESADLERARMARCSFRGCSFRQASLADATLNHCRLLGCNLDEAAIDGARGLPTG